MPGMSIPQETWYASAAGYLGMWMAMMLPMMLPALIPMLLRYRQAVRGAGEVRLHGLTAIVLICYLAVWALVGLGAHAATAAFSAAEVRWAWIAGLVPVASGLALVAAGAVQFTAWKARWLMLCRAEGGCDGRSDTRVLGALHYGLRAGARCSLCCGNLMVVLLVTGLMEPVAMLAVALALSAERLAPAPLRVARASGVAIAGVGMATAMGLGGLASQWPR